MTVTTRVLVLDILSMLERHGWSLYASIDQSTGVGLSLGAGPRNQDGIADFAPTWCRLEMTVSQIRTAGT